MIHKLIIIFLALGLMSCKAEKAEDTSNYYNGFKYWIFISDAFTPDFKEINVGDRFGNDKAFSSGQIEEYGEINVIWDGTKDAVFSEKGSKVLFTNRRNLKLAGVLKKPLQIIIFQSESNTTLRVIHMQTLKVGDIQFEYEFE